eukprot:3156983-Amphidinium_carterae.1
MAPSARSGVGPLGLPPLDHVHGLISAKPPHNQIFYCTSVLNHKPLPEARLVYMVHMPSVPAVTDSFLALQHSSH